MSNSKIRKPYCAGSWYSDNPKILSDEIDGYLNNVSFENLNVKAVIVPHAGYMFSGQTAAYSFRQLNKNVNNIIILGTAHKYPLEGASVTGYDYYESPLGLVKVSDSINSLIKEKGLDCVPKADSGEHSIEIEIPFLQRTLEDFSIIPIIVGKTDYKEFSRILEKYYGENTAIVASVDLSHFHSYNEAKKLDEYSIDCILNLNAEGIKSAEIDSPWAIMALLELAKRKKWKAKLLSYKNSGDLIKDKSSVVGYASIVFYEEYQGYFSGKEIREMELLAKQAVEEFVKTGKRIAVKEISEKFEKKLACFVTLKLDGELRGCIGTIEPVDKLWKSIIDNAISAASRDWRFEPVQEYELPDLSYEVSVLSEPLIMHFSDPKDIAVGIKDKGLIIEKDGKRAVYLPQVWEHFKNSEDFLSSLCRKAGLPGGEWKKPGMKFFVFDLIK